MADKGRGGGKATPENKEHGNVQNEDLRKNVRKEENTLPDRDSPPRKK
jgi:hypothetical protein